MTDMTTIIRFIKIIWYGLFHMNATPEQKTEYLLKIGAIKKTEKEDMISYLRRQKINEMLKSLDEK